MFNDTEITEESAQQKGITFINEGDNYKLIISKLSSESFGSYKILAKNHVSSSQSTTSTLEIDKLPTITPKFEGENVKSEIATIIEEEQKSLELGFSIIGKPEPTVEHFKDDVKFKPTEKRVLLSKKELGVYQLDLGNLKASDGGIYKIFAKNSCGETQYLIDLKIKSAPNFVKTLKNTIEVLEGTKLELTGTIAPGVYPNPEFQWLKNGEPIDEAVEKNIVILKDNSSSTLIIEVVVLSLDTTKFKLKCFNDFGSCETETRVDILCVPKFEVPLSDCQPLLNQPFDWEFAIDSSPEPKIKILKNDKEWTMPKENKIQKEMEQKGDRKLFKYKIQFNKMVADDIATYQVEASNKAGDAKSKAQLVVIGAPCFIRKPPDTSVSLNKPIKIDCEIAGIPLPTVTWLKDGEQLVESDRVKIENKLKTTYILNIKNCLKEDAGIYTIKLQNETGTAEASFNLTIQGILINSIKMFFRFIF